MIYAKTTLKIDAHLSQFLLSKNFNYVNTIFELYLIKLFCLKIMVN